ncbi:MAG: hypothetical protein JWQ81_1699 [Amycolatopsis sp.]|jgi:hypothetical protein|nr:hypothetical protein [Amycolatopsis sp.]
MITVPMAEVHALKAALEDLTLAFLYSQRVDDRWGALSADRLRQNITARGGEFCLPFWFNRNHLHVGAGNRVYREDDGQRVYGQVLEVTTFAAWADWGASGAEWTSWRYVHTDARRHDEPSFDVTDWGAVARHMGFRRDPGALDPDQSEAKRLLRVVPDPHLADQAHHFPQGDTQ